MPAFTAKPTDDLNVFSSFYLCCYRSELVHGEKKIKKKKAIGNSYLEHNIKQTEMNGYLVSSI